MYNETLLQRQPTGAEKIIIEIVPISIWNVREILKIGPELSGQHNGGHDILVVAVWGFPVCCYHRAFGDII